MSLVHGLTTTSRQPEADLRPDHESVPRRLFQRSSSLLMLGRQFMVAHRTGCLLVLNSVVLAFVYFIAYFVRFDGRVPHRHQTIALDTVAFVVAVQLACCLLMGAQRGIMRYAAFIDLIRLAEALTTSGFCVALLNIVAFHSRIPRSVILIDWALALLVLGALRGGGRLLRERYFPLLARNCPTPVLVLSASHAGEVLVREIQRQPWLGMRVAGILDADPLTHGCTVAGVKVLGKPEELGQIAERFQVKTLLIPTPAVSGAEIRAMIQAAQAADLKIQVVPGFDALLNGSLTVRPRDVDLHDLLNRDPVRLDTQRIGEFLKDRVVMVTGAAGSIGSEICRQVLKYHPRRLVLLDQSENSLYFIEGELRRLAPGLELIPFLASVADARRLRVCMARHQPEVIFHAAAHKHVPMMERCPGEAIKNNVFGTRVLVDEATRAGAAVLVMISTDKAVNPTSVMGASKRLAEMYVQSMSQSASTRLVTVRFGNVLGSTGSVVPLFKEQILRGGPITVTHPEMTRFFMTIPEASQLVLQAGAIGKTGEILVLDMGRPLKIVDVARDLIRLSGLREGREVEIVYTGLRPGEKLYEELYHESEERLPTQHPKIYRARHRVCGRRKIEHVLERLARVLDAPRESVVAALQEVLPEYNPRPSEFTLDSDSGSIEALEPKPSGASSLDANHGDHADEALFASGAAALVP